MHIFALVLLHTQLLSGVWVELKWCLQTLKTHKHALLHMKNHTYWYTVPMKVFALFPTCSLFLRGVFGRHNLSSCLSGVYEDAQEGHLCSWGYGHDGGSGVFLRCWLAEGEKNIQQCVVEWRETNQLTGYPLQQLPKTQQQRTSFHLLSFPVKMWWSSKVEMTILKLLPSNYSSMWVLDAGVQ